MDDETRHELDALAEAVCLALVVATEQLDMDRLIAGLKRAHDRYAPEAPAVARHLFHMGKMLSQIAALREKRAVDPH